MSIGVPHGTAAGDQGRGGVSKGDASGGYLRNVIWGQPGTEYRGVSMGGGGVRGDDGQTFRTSPSFSIQQIEME